MLQTGSGLTRRCLYLAEICHNITIPGIDKGRDDDRSLFASMNRNRDVDWRWFNPKVFVEIIVITAESLLH